MRKLLLPFLLLALGLQGQSESESPWQLERRAYLKYMASPSWLNENFIPPTLRPGLDFSTFDQLVHNRFDFNLYRGQHWQAGLSVRNRFFEGSQVRNGQQAYADLLSRDEGLVDLSWTYGRGETVLFHTMIDRLWFQWQNEQWTVRMGRQRINWGKNTVWNPNDIFNQYNFFDFDYEERPGSDALRVQFSPNFNSTWELAYAPAERWNEATGAVLYRSNYRSYDWQVLVGHYKNDLTLGAGWAGAIGKAGFKGEFNYYTPFGEDFRFYREATAVYVASLSLDYIFANGLYVQGGYLYNHSAAREADLSALTGLSTELVQSPKNIFIYRHTGVLSGNFAITPLLNASLTFMFTPEFDQLILYPSLSYSLMEDLDLLWALQWFNAANSLESDQVQWFAMASFLRLKWSF